MHNIPDPGLTWQFLLYLLLTLPFVILSIIWLVLPLLLIARLRKIHETLLRIEMKGGKGTAQNPFEM